MRETLLRFWALLKKEALTIVKEPSSRGILLGPMFLMILAFGWVATFNLDRVPYALCDLSHSAASVRFVSHLEGSGLFERVETLPNTAHLADAIDRGDAMVAVVIAPDFASKIAAGRAGDVQVIVDGRNSTTAQMAAGYVVETAARFSMTGEAKPFPVATRLLYNPNNLTRRYLLPVLIVMLSMIQVTILSALSVAKEKEEETFEQLLVTPYPAGELLLAKALVPMAIGLIQGTIILTVVIAGFDIRPAGALWEIYTVLLAFLMVLVGFGLTVSAAAKTMQQALLFAFSCIMPMILLSGLLSPIENMPAWVEWLTRLNPLRWAVAGVRRIYLADAGLAGVADCLLPLLLMALVSVPFAYHYFKKRL